MDVLFNFVSSNSPKAKDVVGLIPAVSVIIVVVLMFLVMAANTIYPQKVAGIGMLLFRGDLSEVFCPVDGNLVTWQVEEGDAVNEGDPLAFVLEFDHKETTTIFANRTGIVAEIIAYGQTPVRVGQVLAIISPPGDARHDLELIGFVSSLDGKKVAPGMKAYLDPTITDPHRHGHMIATVKRVGKLPITKAAILSLIKIPEVADYIRSQIEAEPFVVTLAPLKDENHVTGYRWTGPGPAFAMDSGVFARMNVIYEQQSFLHVMWPWLTMRTHEVLP